MQTNSQRAVAARSRPAPRQTKQPDYIVRAPDPHRRGRWVTLGAAWERDDGQGFNVKLSTVPVGGWDGALVLLMPLEDDTTEHPDPPTDE